MRHLLQQDKISDAAEKNELEQMRFQLEELNQRLIKDNLEKIQLADRQKETYQKLMEMRERLNGIVQNRAELQEKLIQSEVSLCFFFKNFFVY